MERRLRKGATKARLATFQKKIRARLPPTFLAFYEWHDGANDEHEWLEGAYGWFSLSKILAHKKMLDDIRGDDGSWQPQWLPFFQFNYSDLICLDTKSGEVFEWFNCEPQRLLLAPSFDAWLAAHVAITESAKSLANDDEILDLFHSRAAKRIRAQLSPGFPKKVPPPDRSR